MRCCLANTGYWRLIQSRKFDLTENIAWIDWLGIETFDPDGYLVSPSSIAPDFAGQLVRALIRRVARLPIAEQVRVCT